MSGILYLAATPIGNLEDLTFRVVRLLKEADVVVCEDTRVTSKILAHLEIRKPLLSVHEHATADRIEQIIGRLKRGEVVVYASDAGTPGVNDPGGKLVQAAFAAEITIVPLPGPSALTAAISVSGFAMDEFTYVGFIPHKKGRETLFREIAARSTPTICFESTHRIEKTLESLAKALSPKRLLFCGRELTKLHETLYRGTVDEVRKRLQATSQKGEFVLIIGPEND
jgi:16S rRNA (cytidine1402-2'-O)-methyltransferase